MVVIARRCRALSLSLPLTLTLTSTFTSHTITHGGELLPHLSDQLSRARAFVAVLREGHIVQVEVVHVPRTGVVRLRADTVFWLEPLSNGGVFGVAVRLKARSPTSTSTTGGGGGRGAESEELLLDLLVAGLKHAHDGRKRLYQAGMERRKEIGAVERERLAGKKLVEVVHARPNRCHHLIYICTAQRKVSHRVHPPTLLLVTAIHLHLDGLHARRHPKPRRPQLRQELGTAHLPLARWLCLRLVIHLAQHPRAQPAQI
mmetsp:Transcript_35988/g.93621  ORF Transcript_35988/g.93621 Transcript_35988/m.93621 type:complete len:259 (+) Transcript_35988:554-1330(+)